MAEATPQPEAGPQGSLEDRVLAVLDEVRPMLQSDGGDLEYLGLTEDHRVRIRLVGACKTCPSQRSTLSYGVEAYLREQLPEIEGLELAEPLPEVGQNGVWGVY